MKASDLYNRLIIKREKYLKRAEDSSKLTIPQLFNGVTSDEEEDKDYPTPYQSLGARGVNNLANKMILSLFPPATAFFKLGLNPILLAQLKKGEGEIDSALYTLEKGIVNEMETSQFRSVLVDAIKQLIVGGSIILHIPKQDDPRVIPLGKFGIKRSKSGKVLEMCIKEQIYYVELDKEVIDQLKREGVDIQEDVLSGKKPLDIYTVIIRKDAETLTVHQDILGVKLDKTDGEYKERDLPYVFVPFVERNQDYGRSYTEDFIGDLMSYEGLRQSILEASAEAARIIYLVKPNAVLDVKQLQKARSGDAILGNIDDVGTLQADKRLDVGMAQTEAEVLRQDLSKVFLLDSAVQRNAERVTAEEIRKVAQELEVSLGGIYSTLANRVQAPSVHLYLGRLKHKGLIADDLKDSLEFEVTTGSAALGRGSEFNALTALMSSVQSSLGPEASIKYFRVPELLARLANSLDIGTASLIKTQEELMAEEQAAQQAQLQQAAVAPLINGAARQQQPQG